MNVAIAASFSSVGATVAFPSDRDPTSRTCGAGHIAGTGAAAGEGPKQLGVPLARRSWPTVSMPAGREIPWVLPGVRSCLLPVGVGDPAA
jgi:hypothetical protein